MSWRTRLDEVLEAARQHGEDSAPEMEVGDLHACLWVAWKLMLPAQRKAFYDSDEVQLVLESLHD